MKRAKESPETLDGGATAGTALELPDIGSPRTEVPSSNLPAAPEASVTTEDSSPSLEPTEEQRHRRLHVRTGMAILGAAGLAVSAVVLSIRHRSRQARFRRFFRRGR